MMAGNIIEGINKKRIPAALFCSGYFAAVGFAFEGNFENGQTALNVTPLSKQTLVLIRRFAPLIPKDANLRELSLRARFVLVLGTPEMDLHTTLPRAFLRSIRTQDSALKLDVQQEGAKCVK